MGERVRRVIPTPAHPREIAEKPDIRHFAPIAGSCKPQQAKARHRAGKGQNWRFASVLYRSIYYKSLHYCPAEPQQTAPGPSDGGTSEHQPAASLNDATAIFCRSILSVEEILLPLPTEKPAKPCFRAILLLICYPLSDKGGLFICLSTSYAF